MIQYKKNVESIVASSTKAVAVGTAGFGTVDVLDKCYGTYTDPKTNANKFYTAELHKDQASGLCLVYVHYGRIGAAGTKKEILPLTLKGTDEHTARAIYHDKLKSKMKTPKCSSCGNRSDLAGIVVCSGCARHYNFKDYTYKYVPVELAQASTGSSAAQAIVDTTKLSAAAQANVTTTGPAAPKKKARPAMPRPVANMLQHFYEEAGKAARSKLNTGALKATADNPLGTLSAGQIQSGKDIVDEIRTLVADGTGNPDFEELMRLTAGYYTAIPQAVRVGSGKAAREAWRRLCINDLPKLNEAIDLLDLLGDVKGVQSTFTASTTDWDRYDAIGAKIEVVEKGSKEYRDIVDGIMKSRGGNHGFARNLKIRGVYRTRVKSQSPQGWFDSGNYGNHQHLYHGSRNANMMGITSKGLLMRPPGAVVTGSMFGNGLYFADSSSKSLNYSRGGWGGTRNSRNNVYLFVVNVALGRIKKLQNSQSDLRRGHRLLKGYNSIQGEKGRSLIHNEFIIYELPQQRIEYIVDIDC